ncbi:putative ABC transport system permease protein [Actinocorallia herbida]|uniref:Putative ABC transport system permease protein n=1 Tax=Actinocorallia herbida TaxID=58109 RepID=A0A3N1CV26_9ACTN|nr:ABC transporter permease [Actinocorallia herbida]ROO85142.1 putative ABC transport system permease protein [Actinocorallia herbida]
MRAVWRAALHAVRRRRLQTTLTGVVLALSTAMVVLALGLLVTVDGPYDRAFAQVDGAHLTVSYAASDARDDVAATSRAAGVTGAVGPFRTDVAEIPVPADEGVPGAPISLPPGQYLLAERTPSDADPVDRLTLREGRWAGRPGEIVLSAHMVPDDFPVDVVGTRVAFADGRTFTAVGVARSITGSADGWIAPGQLPADGDLQMLYRLADPGSAASSVTGGLVVTGRQSYLVPRQEATDGAKTVIPFLATFGIAGLLVAVIIIGNVVGGAVVSGLRHIGILKAIGFSPAQVTAVYLVMTAIPAVLGAAVGIAVGNALARLLAEAMGAGFDLPTPGGVSPAVDAAAFAGVLAVAAVTALVPAVRAGRIPAALAVGAGPRAGRGRAPRVQLLLARTRLPRPVSLGLGLPFARPGRSSLTVAAVLLGVAAVVFSYGLQQTVVAYYGDESRESVYQVGTSADLAVLEGRPGTARIASAQLAEVRVPGVSRQVTLKAYEGPAADRHGHRLTEGRWLRAPGEAVVSGPLLRKAGLRIGDVITPASDTGSLALTVVGASIQDDDHALITDAASLRALVPDAPFDAREIALTAGTSADDYVASLIADGHQAYAVSEDGDVGRTVVIALMGVLSFGIAAVAGLGVFNTVVLNTLDRARDFGVLKSLGATPRQITLIVVSSMALLGLAGGLLGLPLGLSAYGHVLPRIAESGGVDLPYGITEIFPPASFVLFALAGAAIAVGGALIPATWAARTTTATALRAE